MVVPTLTYRGILHLNQNRCQQTKIESFHRRAIALIGSNGNGSIRLKSPPAINKIRGLELVHHCIKRNTCSNFSNYFELTSHGKLTRNNGYIVKLPKLKLEYARGSFYYMGDKLYNELPREIRSTDNFERYSCLIRKHFQ